MSYVDPFGLSTEPGLIDETDVLIDVASTIGGTTIIVIGLVDGPIPDGEVIGGVLVGKGISGLARKQKVVIGETMKRVVARAKEIGARYYKPRKTIAEIGKRKALENNRRWLRRQIREGKEIVDIGIDRGRADRSIFYKMERELLDGS